MGNNRLCTNLNKFKQVSNQNYLTNNPEFKENFNENLKLNENFNENLNENFNENLNENFNENFNENCIDLINESFESFIINEKPIKFNISEKTNYSDVNEILLSKFLLPGMNLGLNDIPNNHWILMVGYPNADAQIGVTGKVKINEKSINATQREIYEECNLIIKKKKNLSLISNIEKNDRKISTYIANINNFSVRNTKEFDKYDYIEDTKDKVGIILHGNKKDLFNKILLFSKKLNQAKNIDNIGYFLMINKKICLKCIDIIKNNKNKNFKPIKIKF